MAMSSFLGVLTTPTATGNVATTGVGFQPKLIIFFGDSATAEGFSAGQRMHFGATSGATESFALAAGSDDAANPSNVGHRNYAKCVGMVTNGAPTADAEANLVSFDADGFTLNWTDAPASAYRVYYLALGGSTITNAKVAQVVGPTATGNFAITGVGFQPDAVICWSGRITGAAPASSVHFNATVGTASSATEMACSGINETDAATTTDASCSQSGSKILFSGIHQATLVSFDADGFTLNFSTVAIGSVRLYYVAIKGGVFQTGVETQGTSVGTKDTATTGFTPRAVLFTSFNRVATASVDTTLGKLSIGASDGINNGCIWNEIVDGRDTTTIGTNTNKANSATKALVMASSDATTDAEASCAFAADKFTLDWTTADATAREFAYLAIGEVPSVGGGGASNRLLLGVG